LNPAGTGGVILGTSGEDRRILRYGGPVMAAIVVIVGIVNVVTIVHDHPNLNPLEPVIWEGSSVLLSLILLLVPWAMSRWASRRMGSIWLVGLALAAVAPLYSLVHVFGFLALREAAYALAGGHYRYGPLAKALPYEMSKDVLAYAAALALFWLVSRLLAQTSAAAPASADGATFDIRDGARVIRVPVADILAISSAGNYVEILLADGRKPLMRSPLATLEAELAGKGFVRTHRSWLVNARRVTGLKPEGSGDYEVELGEVSAPLSRRFPDALARLREG
jgi:DNA-binding LytR/AlgR family response regulator